MGNNYLKKSFLDILRHSFVLLIMSNLCHGQADEKSAPPSLRDAFSDIQKSSTAKENTDEVEPIVVGREKWSDRPDQVQADKQSEAKTIRDNANSEKIQELDPLETKQGQVGPSKLPMKAPTIPPAVNLHRNFEGKLILKPRNFGFEKAFPYQLENSRGKRLAYIDFENVRSIDPIDLKDKRVNVLGKLEPIKEGSDDLVIRARILREIE